MTNHLTVLTNKQCRQQLWVFFLMLELFIIYPMLHYKNTDIIIILFCDLT